jgi:hypothetical protein
MRLLTPHNIEDEDDDENEDDRRGEGSILANKEAKEFGCGHRKNSSGTKM